MGPPAGPEIITRALILQAANRSCRIQCLRTVSSSLLCLSLLSPMEDTLSLKRFPNSGVNVLLS